MHETCLAGEDRQASGQASPGQAWQPYPAERPHPGRMWCRGR